MIFNFGRTFPRVSKICYNSMCRSYIFKHSRPDNIIHFLPSYIYCTVLKNYYENFPVHINLIITACIVQLFLQLFYISITPYYALLQSSQQFPYYQIAHIRLYALLAIHEDFLFHLITVTLKLL